MIIVLSPAKSLNFEKEQVPTQDSSETRFRTESFQLIKELRNLSREGLSNLMTISTPLADLNYQRFKSWRKSPNADAVKQAVYAFDGDVYTGLEASTIPLNRVQYMQNHVRILSGLYGLLRPLDMMQPYRLEMGTKLKTSDFKNLYQFWDDKITVALKEDIKNLPSNKVIINLASKEYFKSVKVNTLELPVVTIDFKDFKNGQYKVLSFFAKKARGRMTREIILNELTHPEEIKSISFEGYSYNPRFSDEYNWVFTRKA